MATKRFFIYFLMMLIAAYPVSAAEVSLNRWVLNVTLHDDGKVEEVIQAEIENSGSLPLDGFSFVVPASGVTIIYDFDHTSSFTGQVVEQQSVPGGTKIIVNFNSSVEAGKKWDGRIGFTAENWAASVGSNYSIEIPVEAPQAIVAGKNIDISVPGEAEIRSQVFLPAAVEVTSVTPKPFKILFQFDHMVPTWSPETLHAGDVIQIKSSFSSVLNKIVKTDEKWRALKAQINTAKAQGINVSEAETHLNNAEDYNTNQALQSFWKNEDKVALEYVGYANDELNQTENSLSTPKGTESPQETAGGKKTPGFGVAGLILVLLIYLVVKKK
ncbi:MAG: hypothetical protein ABOK23_05555 [Candidatus Methanoperedens sp.]|nr:hypothetical protein [Candidatus Methanoperedens sp.]MCZ7396073.1 hypothetical protein [Candidatus Methanoperedens sp.]